MTALGHAPGSFGGTVRRVLRTRERKTWLRNVWAFYCKNTLRRPAGRIGSAVLPPWRCPGCGGWRRRRLALCRGVVAAPYYRELVYANGCPACGLLYTAPRPRAAGLAALYSEHGEWAASHPPGAPSGTGGSLAAALDAVTGYSSAPRGSQVLDFGCGHGRWLDRFAACGWQTFGIDPAIKSAFDRHIELREPGPRPRFLFVVLSHVLEHLRNPGDVLESLGGATLRDGWIYISVPSLDRLPEHRDWKYVLNARTHIAAYSQSCLAVLLGRAGFGEPIVLPVKDGKAKSRLRVVARRGAPAHRVESPLESARAALAAAGVLDDHRRRS